MIDKVTLKVPIKIGKRTEDNLKSFIKGILPTANIEVEYTNQNKICVKYENNSVVHYIFFENEIDYGLIARIIGISNYLKISEKDKVVIKC